MTDPTSHSEPPDSEDSPALRVALLELLASNVRDYKRQQWSTAYYGLLVHGAIVGYFSLRNTSATIDDAERWLLVALAWVASAVASLFITKTQVTIAKERSRTRNVYRDLPTLRKYVDATPPHSDREFQLIFSMAMVVAFTMVFRLIKPNEIDLLVALPLLLLIAMTGMADVSSHGWRPPPIPTETPEDE